MSKKIENYIYVPVVLDGENEVPFGDSCRFKELTMLMFFESGAEAQQCIDRINEERKEAGETKELQFKIVKYQRI
jgi:hypothetical protein